MATLKTTLYSATGKSKGEVSLPAEMFSEPARDELLAQAVRVYLANQRRGTASTLSRALINKTKAKWYRQKGTGRARHGAKSAPIFVGGGVAHGPKGMKVYLNLPDKMKAKALVGALTLKYSNKNLMVVDDLSQIRDKTKNAAKLLSALGLENKRVVWIAGKRESDTVRAVRNIDRLKEVAPQVLNAYQVLANEKMVIDQEAIETLRKRLGIKEVKKAPIEKKLKTKTK